jgi:hypothetical protein
VYGDHFVYGSSSLGAAGGYPYLQVPATGDRYQATPDAYREQVLQGLPMGLGYYLKAFPVWFARRGNYGVLLSQAKGLSTAARLRGDWAAADLAQKQLQWVIGRNPFAQSTMWGEGYDYTQQYSVSSGDIVGSLPVGMMTRGNSDVPYWPSQNCYVYKEVWVHSSARWLWLMEDLAGPALVEGRAAGKIDFVDRFGKVTSVVQDTFRTFLLDGLYIVRSSGQQTTLALLPGETYHLDLRPGHIADFSVRQETMPDGEVTIRVTEHGAGRHTFSIRADNLMLERQTGLTWHAHVATANAPWVAIVIPDNDLALRREVVHFRCGLI